MDEMADDPARQDAIDAVVPYLGDEDGMMQLAARLRAWPTHSIPPLLGGYRGPMDIDPALDDAGFWPWS
jgi:hypothetical protein